VVRRWGQKVRIHEVGERDQECHHEGSAWSSRNYVKDDVIIGMGSVLQNLT
jgi:hypothetical protein